MKIRVVLIEGGMAFGDSSGAIANQPIQKVKQLLIESDRHRAHGDGRSAKTRKMVRFNPTVLHWPRAAVPNLHQPEDNRLRPTRSGCFTSRIRWHNNKLELQAFNLAIKAAERCCRFGPGEDGPRPRRLSLVRQGRHPTVWNLGDCFSYVLAKGSDSPLLLDLPLLFQGNEFGLTDLRVAHNDVRPLP